MRHILFLPSWYPNRVYPQNGDFVQRHAEAVSIYCKVGVLYVLAVEGQKKFEVETSWHKQLFEVRVYFPKSPVYRPLTRYQNYLKAHRMGYAALLKEMGHIDLVHLNVLYKAGLFALELKKKYQLPYIVTEHWTAFLPINPTRFSLFEKYMIRKIGREASLLCPVSHDLKRALKDFGISGPYEVVPNVVDTKLFSVREKRGKEKKRILHISTLNDVHKNVSGLLDVIKKLSLKRKDFTLSIVGNDYIEKHQKTIERLSLQDIVNIKGEIPHEAVASTMQEHDLFVLFSNFENLPCVIIEAQASGLPVLASDVGGINEMVNDSNGKLVAARDEAALFEKLNRMLDGLEGYDRGAIRLEAVERFSYEEVGERFLAIYDGILEGGN
ncbi:MAG: glycosyltransferase [Saprospiraceae bacterium]